MFKPENASRVFSLSVLSPHRQFQFHKRGQLFIGPHNEPLSIAAMCVSNPSRSAVRIQR